MVTLLIILSIMWHPLSHRLSCIFLLKTICILKPLSRRQVDMKKSCYFKKWVHMCTAVAFCGPLRTANVLFCCTVRLSRLKLECMWCTRTVCTYLGAREVMASWAHIVMHQCIYFLYSKPRACKMPCNLLPYFCCVWVHPCDRISGVFVCKT